MTLVLIIIQQKPLVVQDAAKSLYLACVVHLQIICNSQQIEK